ncbi:hypothetical protein ACWDXU_34390, partial [Nocardia sp. NPDC003167]
ELGLGLPVIAEVLAGAAAITAAATTIDRHWAPPWIVTAITACLIYLFLAGCIVRRTDGLTIRTLRGPKPDDTVANRPGDAHRSSRHGDDAGMRDDRADHH